MKLLDRLHQLAQKKNAIKSGFRHFVKEPLVFVGLASAGTFSCNASDVYGPPDPVCEDGERECVENYAMICYGNTMDRQKWFGLECEKGCSEGACIDKKVKNGVVTDCKTGDSKDENSVHKICIDGVWFNID